MVIVVIVVTIVKVFFTPALTNKCGGTWGPNLYVWHYPTSLIPCLDYVPPLVK